MTGRQCTTTSPSSTSSTRSTPCVDGCWGPMLTFSSSRASGLAVSVTRVHAPRHGEVDGLRAERLGASKRMAAPFVGQHDASQLGVALKVDTEQVVHLALVPV